MADAIGLIGQITLVIGQNRASFGGHVGVL